MKARHLKVNFKDARGEIKDILDDVPLNSITLITSKKGAVRGNHYHKKTVQYVYILEGRIRYVTRKGKGPVVKTVLKRGDLAVSPPMEAHTMVALADSSFLALSHGPRHGGNFEADTYRLEKPLVIARHAHDAQRKSNKGVRTMAHPRHAHDAQHKSNKGVRTMAHPRHA